MADETELPRRTSRTPSAVMLIVVPSGATAESVVDVPETDTVICVAVFTTFAIVFLPLT